MLTVPGSDSEAAADSESDRRGLPGRHCASDPTRTRGVGLAEQRSAGLGQRFAPSQLWIRMQFAPELEEPHAFNWFPVVLVVGK